MPETTSLKIKLFIHDLKAPLAVIDLGARSLKDRQATYGPLTDQQEYALDRLLQQTEGLRHDINRALSGRQGAGVSPADGLGGMLKRLIRGTSGPDNRPPPLSADDRALARTRQLLLDIEAHLHGLDKTVHLLASGDPATGTLTPRQEKVFSRLKRNAGFSRILIENAKILLLPRGEENQPRRVRVWDAIRRPLVEILDLYHWQVADDADELTTAEGLANQLAGEGLFLEIETGLLDRQCVLDTGKLGQVLVNLLLNAFKFRRKAVRLSAAAQGQCLALGVRDDGEGMSDEVRRAVLAGGFQARPDKGFPIQGHGIGLAGAHVLIEEMGGELTIESTPGKGTKVSVVIPCGKG